ncbi:hypothetical protein NQ176_g3456 [Zarea fungicola]|uniref:Uncharacterized protein n=1 Tax=Zarea fungicola TaxID=93591 RepID=A0ACC1NKZ3_9HYPO|nr:hypothetical protein NQ176_g3456 [Lecanicillium fungicola]
MVTAISCWGSAPKNVGKLVNPQGLLDMQYVNKLIRLVQVYNEGSSHAMKSPSPCIDIVGIVAIFDWIAKVVALNPGPAAKVMFFICGIYQSFIFQEIGDSEALRQIQRVGVCSSRLGNLLVSDGYQPMALIAITRGLKQLDFPHKGDKHSGCTDQLCLFADDNSTSMTQMHPPRCAAATSSSQDKSCPKTNFPPDELRKHVAKSASEGWINTAWDVSGWEKYVRRGKGFPSAAPLLKQPTGRYVAISHVWSDGTGVGISEAGTVNSCLAAYFASIALRLGCDGLWWDAICIPSGREEKRKAMDRMLDNYTNAAHTVVHDKELANFEWKDDGTPAMAVVLSSWFTRGWTAAELFASGRGKGSVKILFKDPNSPEPLIKDLETQVLAPLGSNGPVASHGYAYNLAHLAASDIIRKVWAKGETSRIQNLPHLMRVLRPRTTSWAKDRLILASLLCLEPKDVNTSRTAVEQTKELLRSLKRLPATYLYHSEVSMAKFGPYSWCPPSVFDLGKSTETMAPYLYGATVASETPDEVYMEDDGVIGGCFDVFTLSETDCEGIQPYGQHPSVLLKIRVALGEPHKCVLVQHPGEYKLRTPHTSVWILAQRVPMLISNQAPPQWLQRKDKHIYLEGLNLRYVGCVVLSQPTSNTGRKQVACLFGMDADQETNGKPMRVIDAI